MTRRLDDDATPYDASYWQNRLQVLQTRIRLPDLAAQQPAFANVVAALDASRNTLNAVTILRDNLSKQPSIDAKIMEQANAAVASATESVQQTDAAAMAVAQQALKRLEQEGYFAAYCFESEPDKVQALLDLFRAPHRLMEFMQFGSPSHNRFGQALEIYTMLCSAAATECSDDDKVLRRLALAVALELAAPEDKMVLHPTRTIDPLQRFQHYQQAYLTGQLDPDFGNLTVWELRMVIDSDATEDELGWGRASAKNHRPDLVLMENAQWKYCRIVRTDVGYRDPDFYKEPRSYDQILDGGGKCGPRAWYGRFVCKAFGCPTWGVTQPGHAAMSRWTRNGWVICLGAGFDVSFWLDRCGNDFLLETKARSAIGNDAKYMTQVNVLEWAALCVDEKPGLDHLRRTGETDAKYLWTALSFYQRRIWAAKGTVASHQGSTVYDPRNQLCQLKEVSLASQQISVTSSEHGDSIVIPAESFSEHSGGDSLVMKSFLGGLQLWLGPSAEVSYLLDKSMVNSVPTCYKVTLYMNTIHRGELPLILTVTESGNEDAPTMVYQIPLGYTMGLWEATEPVEIELGGPDIDSVELSLARQTNQFGVAIKRITLVPVEK
ncbi:hypothetical protein MPSEU_000195600 [Mayamaea pseudoterrestris]|nr:hypothetical protein MPSEU_000195600 [Mayamaea pseudoterrestris]